MNIGEEGQPMRIEPLVVPVPQRERRSPGKPTQPTRRPAVAPKKAPDNPTRTPERTPVKQP